MAVTITVTRIGRQSWRLDWSSDLGGTPVFYVYVDGILAETTTRTWRQFDVAAGEQLNVEVLDDSGTAPQPGYPGRPIVGWQPVSGAASYRVDRYEGGEWVEKHTVQDLGQSWFWVQGEYLADDTVHQYRVMALDAGGIEGTVKEFDVHMVRRPDPPEYTASLNVDGTINLVEA